MAAFCRCSRRTVRGPECTRWLERWLDSGLIHRDWAQLAGLTDRRHSGLRCRSVSSRDLVAPVVVVLAAIATRALGLVVRAHGGKPELTVLSGLDSGIFIPGGGQIVADPAQESSPPCLIWTWFVGAQSTSTGYCFKSH